MKKTLKNENAYGYACKLAGQKKRWDVLGFLVQKGWKYLSASTQGEIYILSYKQRILKNYLKSRMKREAKLWAQTLSGKNNLFKSKKKLSKTGSSSYGWKKKYQGFIK
ncbi:hypothetical protein ACFLZV_05905 [Candidatus Margulisiibacteriota bacterium]